MPCLLFHRFLSTRPRSVPKLYNVENELLKPKVLNKTPTHELVTKLGLVTHPKPGLVHWLPIGIQILKNLKHIISKEMDSAGGEEVSLSVLSHASLWEKTGRWGGSELFKLKDSANNDFCLAPTCEEEITHLVKNQIRSYKNLPLLYYQINTKFRDEKRPRSGLLRGREFIMKDAYSFDTDEGSASMTYERVVEAYSNVFSKLKIPYVKAHADTGEIGGTQSHEWHYIHPTGEDTLFICPECKHTLNIEKTLSFPTEEQQHDEVSVRYFTTTDEKTLVCAYFPSSRTIRPAFLKEDIPDINLSDTRSEEHILDLFRNEDELIGKRIVRIMDSRLNSRSNFPDFPINFINRSLITTLTDVPIVEAESGELCYHCESGQLELSRAIEVGHTFNLGTKYSHALECSADIPQEDGKMVKRDLHMGCYGIGLSRIIAAIAEINRDSKGLRWPAAIAPWGVTLISAASPDVEAKVRQYLGDKISYRLDDRSNVGLGRKIKDSNMMGIPLVMIVGKNFPIIEIEERAIRDKYLLAVHEAWQNKTFDWDIIDQDQGVKHRVAIEGASQVIAALLQDM